MIRRKRLTLPEDSQTAQQGEEFSGDLQRCVWDSLSVTLDHFLLKQSMLGSTGCGLSCDGVLAFGRINIYWSGLTCCVHVGQ